MNKMKICSCNTSNNLWKGCKILDPYIPTHPTYPTHPEKKCSLNPKSLLFLDNISCKICMGYINSRFSIPKKEFTMFHYTASDPYPQKWSAFSWFSTISNSKSIGNLVLPSQWREPKQLKESTLARIEMIKS